MSLFSALRRHVRHAKQFSNSRSAPAKLASAVIETLENRRLLSAGPTVAGIQVANLATQGQNTIVVDVTYDSAAGINELTLNNNDLTVTDPAGEKLQVNYVSFSFNNNSDGSVTAVYDLKKDANGDDFTAADNGTYAINVQDVADDEGHVIASQQAGSVNINISGTVAPPTAKLRRVATVTSNRAKDVVLSVTYNSTIGIDDSTLGNNNITVTGPDDSTMDVSLAGSMTNANGSVTAKYDVSQAGGGKFTSANNGTYKVSINATGAVTDQDGTPVAVGKLGKFKVDIAAPRTHRVTAPLPPPGSPVSVGSGFTATLPQVNIVVNYNTQIGFSVTYKSSAGIAINTLGDDNLVVGWNWYGGVSASYKVDFVSSVTNADGSVTAKYTVLYNQEFEAGVYTIMLEGNQVANLNGVTAWSAGLGTFSVGLGVIQDPPPLPVINPLIPQTPLNISYIYPFTGVWE